MFCSANQFYFITKEPKNLVMTNIKFCIERKRTKDLKQTDEEYEAA